MCGPRVHKAVEVSTPYRTKKEKLMNINLTRCPPLPLVAYVPVYAVGLRIHNLVSTRRARAQPFMV